MTYVITSLCLRDGGCVDVCPVECILPGKPQDEWPMFYIDPETCIDCGACVPECPFKAIFPEDEVPSAYKARGGELISKVGLSGHFEGVDHEGQPVKLDCVRALEAGEVVDLTADTPVNRQYFTEGPGYKSLQG